MIQDLDRTFSDIFGQSPADFAIVGNNCGLSRWCRDRGKSGKDWQEPGKSSTITAITPAGGASSLFSSGNTS
jgi:hypothetical protein